MYGEEYYDEELEAYYEGRAEGEEMFTEEQHKALDKIMEDAKSTIIENIKKESKRDLNTELGELKRFKENKAKIEKELKDAEEKANELKYEIRTKEYELSQKEKGLNKRKEELEEKYQLAIGKYDLNVETVIKTLLKKKLGQALKEFSLPKFYKVGSDYVKQEKCNLCDENRKRHFTDDLGKTYEVDCPCDSHHHVYKVEEKEVIFTLGILPNDLKDDDSLDELLKHSLLIKGDNYSTDCRYSEFLEKCYCPELETFQEYNERKRSSSIFKNYEDAQAFAKYKQAEEDKENARNYMDLRLDRLLTDEEY